MNWTEREEIRLRELWLAGWTGEQIAETLCMSRDRVLSKVRRMALTRALRFADEVATYGCIEKAARAAGMSARQGRLAFERMRRRLGWQGV